MHADDAFRTGRGRSDLRHRDRRGVRGEHRLGPQIRSSSPKSARFGSSSSTIASITSSQSLEIRGTVVVDRRSTAASTTTCSSSPFSAFRVRKCAMRACALSPSSEVHLAAHHVVAGLESELSDAAAHGTEADDADRADLGHERDRRPLRPNGRGPPRRRRAASGYAASSSCSCAERKRSSSTRSAVARKGSVTTAPVTVESAATTTPSVVGEQHRWRRKTPVDELRQHLKRVGVGRRAERMTISLRPRPGAREAAGRWSLNPGTARRRVLVDPRITASRGPSRLRRGR